MNLGASQFLWGALTMGCLVASLLFLRAWRVSRDRLFVFLSISFLVLALNWVGLAWLHPMVETRVFLFRLLAFSLLIVGIVDKNRRGNRP